jgi:hypothetical protein
MIGKRNAAGGSDISKRDLRFNNHTTLFTNSEIFKMQTANT